ncbi:MAG: PAS domain-containing protein [Halanaerobiales bacterium]|nr:PAS domain-containing protein [Halanaerobiales bacterium]
MSEIIDNDKGKRKLLVELTKTVIKGNKNRDVILKYRDKLKNITPYDVLVAEDMLVKEGKEIKNLKENIEKVLNIIGPYLEDYEWEIPSDSHPIQLLIKENDLMKELLEEIKKITKMIFKNNYNNNDIEQLTEQFRLLKTFDTHYIKKENILFPYLEKIWNFKKPLVVMWSLHEDIRKGIKSIISLLTNEFDLDQFKIKFANLLMLMYRMVFKEENIILPVAYRSLKDEVWDQIYNQFIDQGLFKINTDNFKKKDLEINDDLKEKIDLPTGSFTSLELKSVLNNLPVEISFIDKDDNIKYFSDHKNRIFPRSEAIIGRKVQNCHPPESVHIVEEILKDFKSGKKDKEHFRIKMSNKYIMINYYALRDDYEYIGTLEVTQDITKINSYSGEKRLIDNI